MAAAAMKMYTVFYAGLIYAEYDSWAAMCDDALINEEIRNGCYIYEINPVIGSCWYRSDLQALTEEDIPKELKTWLLLLQ